MTSAVRVVLCAGGVAWEAPLVRDLQHRALGVELVRRCVDHGELLGVADRQRAAQHGLAKAGRTLERAVADEGAAANAASAGQVAGVNLDIAGSDLGRLERAEHAAVGILAVRPHPQCVGNTLRILDASRKSTLAPATSPLA